MRSPPSPPAATPATIPAGIWVLGFVSLLMDVSSELILSLLPVFMVTVLGVSPLVVGLIEGVSEATALIVKVFSGVLSDYFGRRKPLALLGYGLSALVKPLFALAMSAAWVFAARFVDRIGKGLRGAPRDALIADLAPTGARGASFGLRQALDVAGAFIGPLLAMGLMLLWTNDFRAVFWVAVLPGLLAVALLFFGVKEPEAAAQAARGVNPLQRAHLRRLPTAYWWVVAIAALFTLARFSQAFLVLRAGQGGLPIALTPLVFIALNGVYSIATYPLGKLADRIDHGRLLAAGMVLLIGADVALALSPHWAFVWSGVSLWGLHLAATQGLLAAMVADTAPADLRGTAYGLFNLASGVALLLASTLAGGIWTLFGAAFTFWSGAALAGAALAAVWLRSASLPEPPPSAGKAVDSSQAANSGIDVG
jgi:MFS family permease